MPRFTKNEGGDGRALLGHIEHPNNVYSRLAALREAKRNGYGAIRGGGDPNFGFPPEDPLIDEVTPTSIWDGHRWVLSMRIDLAYAPPEDGTYRHLIAQVSNGGGFDTQVIQEQPYTNPWVLSDIGLELGNVYMVRVMAVLANRTTRWSDWYTGINFPINPLIPDPPTNLRIDTSYGHDGYDYDSAGGKWRILWDVPASGAPTYYNLKLTRVSDGSVLWFVQIDGGATSYIIAGRPLGVEYTVEMTAYENSFESDLSDPESFTVPIPPAPTIARNTALLNPPFGYGYDPRTGWGVYINHTPASGLNPAGHILFWGPSNTNISEWRQQPLAGNNAPNAIRAYQMAPGVEYGFRSLSYFSDGGGVRSVLSDLLVYTIPLAAPPVIALDEGLNPPWGYLHEQFYQTTLIHVLITPPPGPAANLTRIKWGPAGNTEQFTLDLAGGVLDTYFRLPLLGVEYTFTPYSVQDDEEGDAGDPITFTPPLPPAPEPQLEEVGHNRSGGWAEITWDTPVIPYPPTNMPDYVRISWWYLVLGNVEDYGSENLPADQGRFRIEGMDYDPAEYIVVMESALWGWLGDPSAALFPVVVPDPRPPAPTSIDVISSGIKSGQAWADIGFIAPLSWEIAYYQGEYWPVVGGSEDSPAPMVSSRGSPLQFSGFAVGVHYTYHLRAVGHLPGEVGLWSVDRPLYVPPAPLLPGGGGLSDQHSDEPLADGWVPVESVGATAAITDAVRRAGKQSLALTTTPPPPLDLDTLPDKLAEYIGDNIAGSNADPIITWPDSSGNDHDALDHPTAGSPTLRTGIANSHSVVRFTGSQALRTDTFPSIIAQPFTFYIVCDIGVEMGPEAIFRGDDPASALTTVLDIASDDYIAMGTTTAGISTGEYAVTGDFMVISGVFNGASSRLRINGGAPFTGNVGSDGFKRLAIGDTLAANVDVAHLLFIEAGHSTGTEDAILAALADLYGVTLAGGSGGGGGGSIVSEVWGPPIAAPPGSYSNHYAAVKADAAHGTVYQLVRYFDANDDPVPVGAEVELFSEAATTDWEEYTSEPIQAPANTSYYREVLGLEDTAANTAYFDLQKPNKSTLTKDVVPGQITGDKLNANVDYTGSMAFKGTDPIKLHDQDTTQQWIGIIKGLGTHAGTSRDVQIRAADFDNTGSVVPLSLIADGEVNINAGTKATIAGVEGVTLSNTVRLPYTTKTATFTANKSGFTYDCDATSGAFTANLPAASTCTGDVYVFVKIDSTGNAVTVDGNGPEPINGTTTYELVSQWGSVMIQSIGSGWRILSEKK